MLAAIAGGRGAPRPACGERATRQEGSPGFGPVRGRFHMLRLAEAPPHPDLLPARGEKETALRLGIGAKQAPASPSWDWPAPRPAMTTPWRGMPLRSRIC